jgi:hypothetical protein
VSGTRAATLREIHDINKSFLAHAAALLAGVRAGNADGLGYVPVVLGLPGGARSLAAQCPYTLYDLRFQDGAFWRSVVAETCAAPPVTPAAAAFGRAAVVLAWHLVRSRELAAPIVLGMAPSVLELWRAMPVSALDHVVASALPHVSARWATNARFWPALGRAASGGNPQQLTDVRLLGMQLLAADGVRASGGLHVRAD